MNLNYSLNHQDFLIYQLYTASNSKIIQKQKRRTYVWIILGITISAINIYNRIENSILFIIPGSILAFIAFHFLLKLFYKSHYSKFIKANYKTRIGQITNFEFKKDELIATNSLAESKIYYNSFIQINEIKDYYFLKLKSEESFIIPKNKIENIKEFTEFIKYLKTEYAVQENIDLNWKQ